MPAAQAALDQLVGLSAATLAGDPALTERIIEDVIAPVIAIARGIAHTKMALESLDIEKLESRNYKCSMLNASRFSSPTPRRPPPTSSTSSRCSSRTSPTPSASPTSGKVILMQRNQDYLVAFMAFQLSRMPVGLPAVLRAEWGERSRAWVFASSLAASCPTSRPRCSSARTTRSSRVRPGHREPLKVAHQKAFIHMITVAERKPESTAHSAKLATGSIPLRPASTTKHARTLLEAGGLGDKLRGPRALLVVVGLLADRGHAGPDLGSRRPR